MVTQTALGVAAMPQMVSYSATQSATSRGGPVHAAT